MHALKGRTPFELSRLGDPFVNFIYSLALSKTFQRPIGKKVSNSILMEALVKSGLRDAAGSRKRKEELGDFAEGLIFSAYSEGLMTLEEAVNILSAGLESKKSTLKEGSVEAFARLLSHVAGLCLK